MPLTLSAHRVEQTRKDTELLKRVQRPDSKALGKLYDTYAPILYPLALRIVNSSEQAEVVVQEVFLHVWTNANTYARDRGSVYSWIVSLCRNKAFERLVSKDAKRKPRESKVEELSVAASQEAQLKPSPVLVLKEYTEAAGAALRGLSKLEMKILEMSYYESHSQSEIARLLRVPLATLKVKMRKGIAKLRQIAR